MRRSHSVLLISVTLLVTTGCEADHDVATRDHIKLEREVPSPDGQLAARYYIEMGGGAAGWVDEVGDIKAIHDSTPPVNKQEAFVMSHGGDVTMRWTAARTLRIE